MDRIAIAPVGLLALLLACGGASGAGPAAASSAPEIGNPPPVEEVEPAEAATAPGSAMVRLFGGNPSPAPAGSTPISEAEAEELLTRFIDLFVELVDAMGPGDEVDCARVAQAMRIWTEAHLAEIQEVAHQLMLIDADTLSYHRQQELQRRIMPAGISYMKNLRACDTDDAVVEAWLSMRRGFQTAGE